MKAHALSSSKQEVHGRSWGFSSPILQPFLKRTLDQKLSSLRSFQKHQYPSLQPQYVFSHTQQNWDPCNKTGYVHSVELWILKVHIHLRLAGIRFHFYMNGETNRWHNSCKPVFTHWSSKAVNERSPGIITLFDAKGLLVPMSQRGILKSTCNIQNPAAGCNLNTQSGAKGY